MLRDALAQLDEDWRAVPLPIRRAVRDGTALVAIGVLATVVNVVWIEWAWPVAPVQTFLLVAVANLIWEGEKWAKAHEDGPAKV